jgi:hypothetical protein
MCKTLFLALIRGLNFSVSVGIIETEIGECYKINNNSIYNTNLVYQRLKFLCQFLN